MVRLTGTRSGTAYIGVQADSPPNYLIKDRRPTTHDYYNVYLGDMWLVRNPLIPAIDQEVWMLVAQRQFQATWIRFVAGGAGFLISLTGDVGGPVFGDALNNVNTRGTANQITVTGNPGTNTLTWSLTNGVAASHFVTDDLLTTDPSNAGVLNVRSATAVNGVADNLFTRQGIAANTITTELNPSIYQPNTDALGNGIYALGAGVGAGETLIQARFAHNFGTDNTFIGKRSGNVTTITGSGKNTGLGTDSLKALTSGQTNTCLGVLSGTAITSSRDNTAVGAGALQSNVVGNANTCVGYQSLFNTTGSSNVAIGYQSGIVTLGADENTMVGHFSGAFLETGTQNILIGSRAGQSYTSTESHNVILNSIAVIGDNNTCRIGTSTGAGTRQLNRTFIHGIRGITTGVNDAIAVLVDSAGQLGTVSSSKRYKENIKNMGCISDAIMRLRPVVFNYKKHAPESKSFGLIAEEVRESFPEMVVLNDEGLPESVKYHDLPVLLLNELQKMQQRIEQLEREKSCAQCLSCRNR